MNLTVKPFLRKIVGLCVAVVTVASLMAGMAPANKLNVPSADTSAIAVNAAPLASDALSTLYDKLNLDSLQLSREAYMCAIKGFNNLVAQGAVTNQHILSIVDFSLPSSQKRLFVLDLLAGKLLFNTYVSHGRNSGKEQATKFSNDVNSFQSSLGFFVTGNTYKGEHGYSLRLEGVEKGINDNALNRGIVIHAANYVNEKMAKQKGYIGRSLGCPAVPVKLHRPIIQTIKDGSCLFLYGPDANYTARSTMIHGFRA
jgi:L,D-transpeptidase-like protein